MSAQRCQYSSPKWVLFNVSRPSRSPHAITSRPASSRPDVERLTHFSCCSCFPLRRQYQIISTQYPVRWGNVSFILCSSKLTSEALGRPYRQGTSSTIIPKRRTHHEDDSPTFPKKKKKKLMWPPTRPGRQSAMRRAYWWCSACLSLMFSFTEVVRLRIPEVNLLALLLIEF